MPFIVEKQDKALHELTEIGRKIPILPTRPKSSLFPKRGTLLQTSTMKCVILAGGLGMVTKVCGFIYK
jgi:hypothetical protein